MKLKQIVCDKTDLTLTKEKKTIAYGEVFPVEAINGMTAEERAAEILATTFKGQPVAEIAEEPKEDKPTKKATKKVNK